MRVFFAGCLLASLSLTLPASAADVKRPVTRSYQIPYRLTPTKHILVRVKVNGKGPYNLILDTGAPAMFLATGPAKKAGVQAGKDGWGTCKRLEIEGGLVLPNARGRVEDPFQLQGMNGLGLAGVELHGMIGYNILAQFRIEIDLTRSKMTWTPLDFKPPPPVGLRGAHGEPAELNAMGAIMKLFGLLLGKKATPTYAYSGFLGIELAQGAAGVEVRHILKDGPAAGADLKPGDRITSFQGHDIARLADIHKWAAHVVGDKTVTLTVVHDGSSRQVSLTTKEGL